MNDFTFVWTIAPNALDAQAHRMKVMYSFKVVVHWYQCNNPCINRLVFVAQALMNTICFKLSSWNRPKIGKILEKWLLRISFLVKFRSSHPEVFLGGALKICSKFAGEHSCRSAISIKLLCSFIEITLRHGCSAVNWLIFSEHLFYKSSYGVMFLIAVKTQCRLTLQFMYKWGYLWLNEMTFEKCYNINSQGSTPISW